MAEASEISEIFADPERSAKKDEITTLTYHLECIAKADQRKLFTEHGEMISPALWPDELAYSVKKLTPHSTGAFIVEFHDKRNAIETLAKLKGLYENDDADVNPLETALAKVPREDLVEIKKLLDTIGGLGAQPDDDEPQPDPQPEPDDESDDPDAAVKKNVGF